MKRTQLAILVLLVVVFGAAALLLVRRSTNSWQSSIGHLPDKVVHLPINDVAQDHNHPARWASGFVEKG